MAVTETTPSGATEATEDKPKRKSFWREFPVLIVIAFAVALLIKTFLLQAFYIPSESMVPTIRVGDRVLVEKVSTRFGEPGTGDVVVFERDLGTGIPEPDRSLWEGIKDSFKGLFGFPTGGAQDFIKRVIGTEGDTVEGKNGRVFLNGELLEEPYLPAGMRTEPFASRKVGVGEIFVMGDNRPNSQDSRVFGAVDADTVVGHAFILIWPPQDLGTL